MTKGIASGRFLACPKTYVFWVPASLARIGSFCGSYLIPDWIMGKHSN